MILKRYVAIARPDHWIKNIFILPGVIFAAIVTNCPFSGYWGKFIVGSISVCLVASANYVINEWLDAGFDKYHPVKKNRPSVVGDLKPFFIYSEYTGLVIVGLGLACFVSTPFFLTSIFLLLMGIIYNVKPFRTKDRVYLDVLSESINNAIRFLLGWFIVKIDLLPPSSLIIGYWMGGAFLMAVKRYSEFRFIGDQELAGLYRRSFKFYNEKSLLISSAFYAMCSTFFVGVFLVKYRIELLLSVPFIAGLFCWYLNIGMKDNSAAQNPEHLYKEKYLFAYSVALAILILMLLKLDIPLLKYFLNNAFLSTKMK